MDTNRTRTSRMSSSDCLHIRRTASTNCCSRLLLGCRQRLHEGPVGRDRASRPHTPRLKKMSFEQTLRYEAHRHALPSAAFQAVLAQSVGGADKGLRHTAVVESFDAVIRQPHAGLGGAVTRELVDQCKRSDEAFIPLTNPWAHRLFMICKVDFKALPPAARMFVDHLVL